MINNTNVENKYTTNGSLATVYPITFQGATSTSGVPHLNITLKTADGTSERQLVYNVDYELVREEIDPSVPQTESMSVPPVIGIKLLNAEDAASGNSLTITRETPFVQHIDYQVGRIDPEQVERAADLDVLRDQELRHRAEEISDVADEALETATEGVELATAAQEDIDGHEADLNNPHQTSLAKLTDTEITGLVTGQFLMYDGIKWKNVYSSTTASWGTILGTITDQTDLMTEFAKYVRTDGSSTMTNPLMMRATESFKCAVAPYWDGIGFFKLNDNDSVTLMASIEYNSGFEPATTNTYNIGANSRKWKNLYLSGTAYVEKLNNGSDINVPNLAGTMLVNRTTATNSISVGGGTSSVQAVQFGALGSASSMSTSYGFSTYASGTQAIAIGHGSQATASKSYAFGEQAISSAIGAFQFGQATNNEAGTVCFALTTDGNTTVNYKLLDSYGLIPGARLADTTSATEGQVLTLDSNLKPTWADASSGSSYHPDLFDWKWADHQLDDVQWLRADTFSWQSGSVYESAYQHLVDEIYIAYIVDVGSPDKYYRMASNDVDGALHPYAWGDNGSVVYYTDSETPQVSDSLYRGANDSTATSAVDEYGLDVALTPQTETIAGTTITYYQATDGHKIVLADQETNVTTIYNATGVAWYYIIDTTNERFKLPRAKPLNGGVAGNGMTLGLSYDSSSNAGLVSRNYDTLQTCSTAYGTSMGTTGQSGTGLRTDNRTVGITTDSTKSGIIADRDNTDQYKYLYFYVGEFTQTAIENTAGLNAELFNDKADKDFGNTTMIDYVVAYQNPTADNSYTWYRKYKSGWVEQGGKASTMNTTIYLPVVMADTNYVVTCGFTIANKGAQSVTKYTDRFVTSSNTNTSYTSGGWIVMGMAAS